jgi:hypothetical protein
MIEDHYAYQELLKRYVTLQQSYEEVLCYCDDLQKILLNGGGRGVGRVRVFKTSCSTCGKYVLRAYPKRKATCYACKAQRHRAKIKKA